MGRKLLWPLSVSRGAPAARPARPAPRPALARRTVERRGGWRPGTPAARGTPPSGGRRPRVTNIPASVCESWSWTVPAFWPEPRRRRVGMRFRAEARGTSRLLRARVRSSTRWMSYATNDVKRYNIRSRFARVLRCPLGHENPKWAGVASTPRPRSLWSGRGRRVGTCPTAPKRKTGVHVSQRHPTLRDARRTRPVR